MHRTFHDIKHEFARADILAVKILNYLIIIIKTAVSQMSSDLIHILVNILVNVFNNININ